MQRAIESSINFWMSACSFYLPRTSPPKKKVTHQNAKFKVTKKAVKESVFYSDAATPEEARAEAWTHFNIHSDKVRHAQTLVDIEIIENPHRMVDDDGHDTVTGIKVG